MNDAFSKLAAALGPVAPRRPAHTPTCVHAVSVAPPPPHAGHPANARLPGSALAPAPTRTRGEAPDRSRDHAVYAAPHRPPMSSAPAFADDPTLRTPRRLRAPLAPVKPSSRRPPPVAVALAVAMAVSALAMAVLACAAP